MWWQCHPILQQLDWGRAENCSWWVGMGKGITWMRCFTLYIAVMAKQRCDMVVHLHSVLKLHQKAPKSAAWLEYDI